MTIEELELRLNSMEKTVLKYGKYIEELEKDVAIVKAVAHPPVFTQKNHYEILVRLEKIENKEK